MASYIQIHICMFSYVLFSPQLKYINTYSNIYSYVPQLLLEKLLIYRTCITQASLILN